MKRTEAITKFLQLKAQPDLAALYSHDMECQVNVAPDGGERIESEYKGRTWRGFTDGEETWKSFRIPYSPMKDPHYDDPSMNFNTDHFDAVGMTGWNWVEKKSYWVAFDFDAILGHSLTHSKALNDSELREIRETVAKVPWVTLRYSSSGRGLHLYVFLDGISTENHTEHAALARAILGKLSCDTSLNLSTKVDVCGGNIWVWSRKCIGTTNGFDLIKQGEVLYDIPPNWKDHMAIIHGRRTRVRHRPLTDQKVSSEFDDLVNQKTNITLDQDHKFLLNWLKENNCYYWWSADDHMLVTHTRHLKEAHTTLNYKGYFDTMSPATNINEQNCFAYPLKNGGWVVRRYTKGTAEAPTWSQDGNGWTRCYYNVDPNFKTICAIENGIEGEKGDFTFVSYDAIKATLVRLGIGIDLPTKERAVTITEHKDAGKVVLKMEKKSDDHQSMFPDWLLKGKSWIKVVGAGVKLASTSVEIESESYDHVIRHLVSENGESAGWVVCVNGQWILEPQANVSFVLASLGLDNGTIKNVLGDSVLKPWRLVVRPFEPEYPGGRVWNRKAPKLKYKPNYVEEPRCETWYKILNHVGESLTPYIQANQWCKDNNIQTGGEYLMLWVAFMIRHPYDPLPYLFIYGDKQATGKSIFHEAIGTLFSPGFQFAGSAIVNPQAFNAELEGAILCVIEEMDLSQSTVAYNRLKDWVTSPMIGIHEKRCTPYLSRNTTHWVHVCNNRLYCPIFHGDTRITMINVSQPPEEPIPKRHLFQLLDTEASDFLALILQMPLPESKERLMLPAIETGDKQTAIESNKTALELFLDKVHYVTGSVITLAEFHQKFTEQLEPHERPKWTKQAISKAMPSEYVRGRRPSDGAWSWGNMSWEPTPPEHIHVPLIVIDSILRPKVS